MSYTKQSFQPNQILYASQLNAMDNQIDVLTQNTDYSTDEKNIGTWIDGKTLYRKTITKTVTINSTSQLEVIENVSGIKIFNVRGIAINENGLYMPLLYAFGSGSGVQTFSLYVYNNELRYDARKIDNATYNLYITIEYTKE